MSPPRAARSRPQYPRLAVAAALGAAMLTASACGPEFPQEPSHSAQPIMQAQPADAGAPVIDAGTPPLPPDFMGGGAPYEAFADGGVP